MTEIKHASAAVRAPAEVRVEGTRIFLRPVRPADVNQRYCDWLNDPEVNRYLETGSMQAFTMRAPGLFGFADAVARRERAASVVRHGLLGPLVPAAVASRVVDPAPKVVSFHIDRPAQVFIRCR